MHSLFWKAPQERGSQFSLLVATVVWTIDSLSLPPHATLLVRSLPFLTAAPLLLLALWLRSSILAILCAAVVLLVIPTAHLISATQKAPAGLLALAASFLLFGFGTAFAVWKRRFSGLP